MVSEMFQEDGPEFGYMTYIYQTTEKTVIAWQWFNNSGERMVNTRTFVNGFWSES